MSTMFVFDEKKVKEIPMVEIAFEILKQSKNNYFFQQLVQEIAKIKGNSEEEMLNNLAQLYTELNIDGRFVHLGQNEWGLKSWFPVDQTDFIHYLRDEEEDDEDLVEDDFEEDERSFADDEESDADEDLEEEEEDEDEDELDSEDDDFVEISDDDDSSVDEEEFADTDLESDEFEFDDEEDDEEDEDENEELDD